MPNIEDLNNMPDRRERVLMPFLGLDFRSAKKRIFDFREVTIPFDERRAKYEALRCIDCPDPPCVTACPVKNDIPRAMMQVSTGDFIGAARTFQATSNMPEICGRVCPQEQLCQGSCVLNHTGEPVLIGAVEAFVTDKALKEAPLDISIPAPTGKMVALVGGGPASLACAEQLALQGHHATIFEAKREGGGLLLFGIPSFKLDATIVHHKINSIKEMGIEFVYDCCVGVDRTIDELLNDYDAIFIGVGAGVDSPITIPGEDLPGVYKATEFLLRGNVDFELLPRSLRGLPEVGNTVIVIGGGDTSADCVRTAKRLGAAEVICLYRRTEDEMPGVSKDRMLAKEEGIEYMFLTQPVNFVEGENGRIQEIECIKMQLGDPDEKGRRRPIPLDGSNFKIKTDTVVLAVGYQPYPTIGDSTPGLETHRWGLIKIDPETYHTTREGVFAGGDAVNGPDLVVTAINDGRKAAVSIDKFLKGKG